ncbi:MAG: polysaccharide biosynthesis/export family protein [Alphaproteobacteria bacterium]|jgi:polysaccharide export outer membrane protein|nr:polysaccharide biosynthesis/export family protein [Alphaproteobacteria bacterium]
MTRSVESGTNAAPEAGRDYALIPIDAKAVARLGPRVLEPLSDDLGQSMAGRSARTLAPGDSLSIMVWEPAPDGLFSSAAGSSGAVPIEAAVDEAGRIFVPYIGRMTVAGQSVETVRGRITRGLAGKAVDPQVQVALMGQEGHMLSVLGDVAAPGRYPIPPGGLRLSEAVALAGGPRGASYASEVSVIREGRRATAQMDDVLARPANDVWLAPRDTIQVREKKRAFSAFGAVGTPGLVPFESEDVSLAEALAFAGGLSDNWADTGGVFLFRFEDPDRLAAAGARVPAVGSRGAPVVYQMDFASPGAMLLAQDFAMRDKDVLYVANSVGAEFRKFLLSFVTPIFSTTQSLNAVGK